MKGGLAGKGSGPGWLAAVAERFGNVATANGLRPGEISDAARHPQYPCVATRGQAHGLGGLAQQFGTGLVGGGKAVQRVACQFGVAAQWGAGQAFGLDGAGGGNAAGDLDRTFGRRRQRQVHRRDGIDINMQVDAVK